MYYIYILESLKNGRWYIGSCQDLKKRLTRHNSGLVRSSKPYAPYKVLYQKKFETNSQARKREIQIKKSGRIRKEIRENNTAPSSIG